MEQYNGTLVLTFLSGEPEKLRLGLISLLAADGASARVTHGDLSMPSYPAANLLMLKEKGSLYQQLLTDTAKINMEDFKVLLRVNMLQERGGVSAIMEAMELLRKNPSAAMIATTSLSEKIGIREDLATQVKREGVTR
ncbi:hypothetical protein EZ449_14285 [Pedobacter frigidisoli]|uniref:Uncharacterized protein n=1 Tax=Pedobacter frigidisoli TaxID=2530455 RepID=A0A4R0P2P9_9SPHI|nr:hypothetical protein [Pedobacter frigidisoli]TCD07698.1 hypothetical protein EZ449_14285 [Pedobacter frigidisoli]